MSEHFKETEFNASAAALREGIYNEVPLYLRGSMLFTLAGLERVRAALGFPIMIESGYRCYALNKLIGGSSNSQHMKAEAVDFVCPAFGSPRQVCEFLADKCGMLGIDQLILESTWVHCSFTILPRKEVLTKRAGNYLLGIV